MAQDNAAKLATYHVPSYRHLKKNSFESTILADYANAPFAVGEQYRQAKQNADAASWYKRALAIYPNAANIEKALASVQN